MHCQRQSRCCLYRNEITVGGIVRTSCISIVGGLYDGGEGEEKEERETEEVLVRFHGQYFYIITAINSAEVYYCPVKFLLGWEFAFQELLRRALQNNGLQKKENQTVRRNRHKDTF